ncbi:MAG: acetyl-CoA carboxylase biotin carboxylase subunit [Actinomycetota bacterium]
MAIITKVLVANRGEIAIRIFRACRELGIASVAIYSEADRDALHVEFADEAYFVGDTPPGASYLNVASILEVARRSGSNAVHPGYGFLAENGGFARAVIDTGMIWIGPPPEAIAAAGDKISARRIAAKAGVPMVPGTEDPIAGPEAIARFALEHGWPVAIKASKGGGGRGFRVVHKPGDAASAYASASREALLAFGSNELYLERYLETPRHIEIQVIADQHGNTLYLGERDCSLQRRHQKLIEESPSPAITPQIRRAMGQAAVKFARQVQYSSAGTVEFLFEQTEEGPRFYFLEMNTRLQVEHPVTELVTGLDLVQLMILVAQGEPLPIKQRDIQLRGHAIECRINAENPAGDFLPNPGTITGYREPGGPGVRVDSCAVAGTTIPPSYDSLIAKLICYGDSREQAIRRTLRALDEYRIDGLVTTIAFHKLALSSAWFQQGEFSTKTVEKDLDLSSLEVGKAGQPGTGPRPRVVSVELEGKRFEIKFQERIEPGVTRLKPRPPELGRGQAQGGEGDTLVAPMQGTIVKILHQVGDRVSAGEPILVLEAMKMENLIACHLAGVVRQINVTIGQTVAVESVLALIEPE